MAQQRKTNKVRIEALTDIYERCAGIDVHRNAIGMRECGDGLRNRQFPGMR
jgi:hypothetical protein